MMITLKIRLQPTNQAREQEIEAKIHKIKKGPGSMDVQAWLLDFKNIYTKAKAMELPDAQRDRATDAFMVAVKPLASPLVAVWEAHYINKELQEYPSIYSTIK
jgi:hypothetical protein